MSRFVFENDFKLGRFFSQNMGERSASSLCFWIQSETLTWGGGGVWCSDRSDCCYIYALRVRDVRHSLFSICAWLHLFRSNNLWPLPRIFKASTHAPLLLDDILLNFGLIRARTSKKHHALFRLSHPILLSCLIRNS